MVISRIHMGSVGVAGRVAESALRGGWVLFGTRGRGVFFARAGLRTVCRDMAPADFGVTAAMFLMLRDT
jgi:hypothetical protein